MKLEKDFIEFLELLNKHEVEYIVIGGHAMAFHGLPRTTGDIDIWINRTDANAIKMIKVVEEFGFKSLGINKKDLMTKGIIHQLGYPPLRIDILNEIDGIEFSQAVKGRLIFNSEQIPISFIGIEDLIANKKASGRPQDLVDLKNLLKKALTKKKAAKKNSRKHS